MLVKYAPFIDLLNSIICGLCSYHLYRAWLRNKDQVLLRYFSKGYLFLIFAYLLFSLPRLVFPSNGNLLGVAFIAAQSLLFLAVAYFAKVTVSLIKPRFVGRTFWTVCTLSAINVVINVIYFTAPLYNSATGVTDWKIHPLVGALSIVIFGGVLIPSSLYFAWQGFISQEKIIKIRSLLIAAGLLCLIATAYTYYTATTFQVLLLSDLLSLLSFLIIFFGVIYKRGASSQYSKTLI